VSDSPPLLALEPVPVLLRRIAAELGAEFVAGQPMRISRAPGRLDVMGGIADYTGSTVCEGTLDRAAAVALQQRSDRLLQVFSFNLLDQHLPFTFGISLDALASEPLAKLAAGFAEPGRRWAAYLAGCLHVLHEAKLVDLANPAVRGLNLALYSTVPLGAGVSSSAAIEVATMLNLADHFGIGDQLDPMRLSVLCQRVENHLVGAPCGIMDQVSSCFGQQDSLLRMVCQPHEIQTPVHLPAGMRVLGINSNVKHSVGDGAYGRTRCAAFMAHKIILAKMGEAAEQHGVKLVGDPLRGYLANLNPDDYRGLLRPHLPPWMAGQEFLDRYGPTIDTATAVHPGERYPVQHAADHHVLEARRVKQFVAFLSAAGTAPQPHRQTMLRKAGHLMYASHQSYSNDAMLGAAECDLLVELIRKHEHAGLYGGKITGGGSGGTVAVLAQLGEQADLAIAEIMKAYQQQSGHQPEAFLHSSPGGWHVGTVVVNGE
jgi:galactokinase